MHCTSTCVICTSGVDSTRQGFPSSEASQQTQSINDLNGSSGRQLHFNFLALVQRMVGACMGLPRYLCGKVVTWDLECTTRLMWSMPLPTSCGSGATPKVSICGKYESWTHRFLYQLCTAHGVGLSVAIGAMRVFHVEEVRSTKSSAATAGLELKYEAAIP